MFKNTLLSVCTGILLFLGVGCQNRLDEPGNNLKDNVVRITKEPEVYAFSGGNAIGGALTRDIPMCYSNAGNGDLGNQVWNGFGAASLKNIEDDEREGVLAEIEKKVTGRKISEDIVFYYENYFLQDVVSGVNTDFPGAGANGTSSASYTMEAYSKGEKCDYNQYDSSNWNKHGYYIRDTWNSETNSPQINPLYSNDNYTVVANSGHITNMYVHENEDKSQTQIQETALMTNMHLGSYEEMKGKQFRWYINCHECLHWSEYIVVKYEGNYYICFDFACGHEENKNIDGHPGRGCETNDWDYNDWVLKITLAGEGKILGENEEPTPPVPPTPGEEEDDEIKEIPDHVEVNLSLEERLSYLTTHLSIHIRSNTDVEVFIPVPAEYVCETDDLAIVQKHQDDLLIHGGPRSVTYNINGNEVTLTVGIESRGIRVTTDGVCEEVIEYLQENYGDGITFEVWNYFNIKHSSWVEEDHSIINDPDDLRRYLNDSTIEFLDNTPSLYVNAFMEETGEEEFHTGHVGIFCDDFTVRPLDESLYSEQETGYFYNFSPYNELYYNK